MSTFRVYKIIGSLTCAITMLVVGCTDSSEKIELIQESATESSTLIDSSITHDHELSESAPINHKAEIVTNLETAYKAPFPERVNLFQAPKRQNSGLAKIKKGTQETSVELLGFVNVDTQRAVLAVNGMVAPIAEGGEHFGIEVISIQPPTVVLQRGRQRWQATLEN